MKVFKFGGASVKSAEAVINVESILKLYKNEELVVVISAMGKTTNTMERMVRALYDKDETTFKDTVEESRNFHLEILNGLFESQIYPIYREINQIFDDLLKLTNEILPENYNFQYDQIVSLGEIISTKIVAAYLVKNGRNDVCWRDARKFIRTNNKYRAADIDWDKTQELIDIEFSSHQCNVAITQGFIGHTEEGFTTSLGREGSDFTAGILAYCLNAESVTIWKDVPGMLNADPKYFENTVKLDSISFKEAIELAYYGASVIHPKTIKPLQNKDIPLYIKSFINPGEEGTVIQTSTDKDGMVPSFIFKTNQVLLSVTPKDFSFIVEENLSDVFKILAQFDAHINVMQNSAVSFTVCMDIEDRKLTQLIDTLKVDYVVKYNNIGVELVTIRHYDQPTIDRTTKNRINLMEQRTRDTVRIVMKKNE